MEYIYKYEESVRRPPYCESRPFIFAYVSGNTLTALIAVSGQYSWLSQSDPIKCPSCSTSNRPKQVVYSSSFSGMPRLGTLEFRVSPLHGCVASPGDTLPVHMIPPHHPRAPCCTKRIPVVQTRSSEPEYIFVLYCERVCLTHERLRKITTSYVISYDSMTTSKAAPRLRLRFLARQHGGAAKMPPPPFPRNSEGAPREARKLRHSSLHHYKIAVKSSRIAAGIRARGRCAIHTYVCGKRHTTVLRDIYDKTKRYSHSVCWVLSSADMVSMRCTVARGCGLFHL